MNFVFIIHVNDDVNQACWLDRGGMRVIYSPMNGFDNKTVEMLKSAGWEDGRYVSDMEQRYKAVFGEFWVPAAAEFVCAFGGLTIGHRLWVYPENVASDLSLAGRIESIIGVQACPVAVSGYMGEDASLWIDAAGRFYVVDSEGMLYVGNNIKETLDVLLLGVRPALAPGEIREAVTRAWEWGAEKEINVDRDHHDR